MSFPIAGRRHWVRWLVALLVLAFAATAIGATVVRSRQTPPAPELPKVALAGPGLYDLPAPASQLTLSGQEAYLALRSAADTGADRLYRLDLTTARLQEAAARRFYDDGVLDANAPQVAGDWLVYVETPASDTGRTWTLAARNLKTGQVVTLDQAESDAAAWPGPEYAAADGWAVWARKTTTPDGPRSTLHAYNLASGERKTLAGALDATRAAWGWPSVRGGRLVIERDGLDPSEVASGLYLVDLASGAVQPLTLAGIASEPYLLGNVVAFKAGPRYGQGQLGLYDLRTGQTHTLSTLVEYPHLLSQDAVLGWGEKGDLLRIDVSTSKVQALATADGATGFRPAPQLSTDGGRALWGEWYSAAGSVQERLIVQE